MELLGRIKQIWRYPVKSMRGEQLVETRVDYDGVVGDRAWGLMTGTEPRTQRWLTARLKPELLLYHPRYISPEALAAPVIGRQAYDLTVETPEGDEFGMSDPLFEAMLKRRFGRSVEVCFSEKGLHDDRPLSLMSVDTIRQLKAELRKPVDPLRFRSNMYVEWVSREGFWERELVGRALRVGVDLDILINMPLRQDKLISFNPATAAADNWLLPHIQAVHHGEVGIGAVVLKPGRIKVGDEIWLLE